MTDLRPVVLSGGSGTRLWPLSTVGVPKQFTPLFGETSLFAMTLTRLNGMAGLRPAIVVTGRAHLDLVEDEVGRTDVATEAIVVEPTGRNTAPAVIAAALVADSDDVLVILPSDHLIADLSGFQEAVATAAGVAQDGAIVTLGVEPTRPETGYGYIEVGRRDGESRVVTRFKEKPGPDEAVDMANDGKHLWNSGMFIARADRILGEARRLTPGVLEGVTAALSTIDAGVMRLGAAFEEIDPISFDYAIMEKTDQARVVPLDVGWSDVGSYRSLLDVSETDEQGNHVEGDVTLSDVSGSYIRATSRRVVVAGVRDLIVVETPDVVLVLPLDRAQEVKKLQSRPDRG